MSDSYKYGYQSGPFYRKFQVGNMGIEVNEDGKGGLWFHMWNCSPDGGIPAPHPVFHFDSEDHFMEFCTKLMGFEALENWEELWRKGVK
jgi:hypothetical protein